MLSTNWLVAASIALLAVGAAQSQTSSSSATGSLALVQKIPAKEARDIEIAGQLLRAGALHMALEHLQTNPPSVPTAAAWQAWAEQKWSILILLKDWQSLKQDAKGLPASFGGVKNFAIAYQAQAMIELGEFDQARRLLQPALQANNIPLRLQKEIRAQLIALYQAQGDYANAKIEAIRFHGDYAPQDTQWFIQRAVIEYLAGDTPAAGQLLAANASIQAKLLLALFRYEAQEIDKAGALTQIERQLQRKRISAAERKLGFGIIAKIANIKKGDQQHDQISMIQALEQYIIIAADELQTDVLSFDPQSLKTAYLELAEQIVNQTLQDPSRSSLKFALAQQLQADDQLSRARALYADIMLNKDDVMLSAASKNQFVKSLIRAEEFSLLTQMLGVEKPLGDYSGIDSTASAQILNHALSVGDANIISSIAPYLSDAPENVSAQDWTLQKARIDIFAGRFKQGRDKIIDWLSQSDILTGEEVDRVLQPVFDLQAVQEDDISLELLDMITSQTHSKRHKREILFWKAQSYEAKDERTKAAQFYLRSALVEANGFDQWGHSSRYHAASTLMEAGEYTDARRLFEGMLAATSDDIRRGTIKQALQRLWLLENQIKQ